jgi:DNA-binding Xre family transcriptional regulator
MTVKVNKAYIKAMLGARDMSLRDLAKRSKVGEATIYRVVNGGAFTSDTLGKIADVLECSPVDLIDPEGYANPHLDAPTVTCVYAR